MDSAVRIKNDFFMDQGFRLVKIIKVRLLIMSKCYVKIQPLLKKIFNR